MKKFLSVITVLLAALVLFSFAACGMRPSSMAGTRVSGAPSTSNAPLTAAGA